ncbi:MAG: hypothetical protein KBA26_00170 [Candidatus Delongbacteria bacterium]|nr:hypothetical protein [Candidatus Delongbacteria bacterium]
MQVTASRKQFSFYFGRLGLIFLMISMSLALSFLSGCSMFSKPNRYIKDFLKDDADVWCLYYDEAVFLFRGDSTLGIPPMADSIARIISHSDSATTPNPWTPEEYAGSFMVRTDANEANHEYVIDYTRNKYAVGLKLKENIIEFNYMYNGEYLAETVSLTEHDKAALKNLFEKFIKAYVTAKWDDKYINIEDPRWSVIKPAAE